MERVIYAALSSLIMITVGACLAADGPPSENINALFNDACDLYEASDLEAALERFESLVAMGVRSSAVYYNLGNCYYKQGRVGKAVASYRRALMMSPRDEDTRSNLDLLRSTIGTRDTTASFGVGGLAQLPLGLASPREWQVIFYGAYYLSVACLLCVLFLRGRPRGKAARILILLSVVSMCSFGFSAHGRSRFNGDSEAVVVAEQTEFMSGPGAAFEELASLVDGAELKLRARSGIWVEVELATGEIGWVREGDLEMI
jgi:tetratricopeptide (TPR) repeat protein